MTTQEDSKTILVTGASSGLGLGIAKAYLGQGANVVLNARNEERLTAAAEGLGQPHRTALVVGDIGLKATGERLVDVALERFGRVDVLVNNAGAFAAKPLHDYTE